MGKFIQYNINNIYPILYEFINMIELGKKYSNEEILKIYTKCKSYETEKTKQGFFSIIKRILFLENNNKEIYLSPIGILIEKYKENKKLLYEIIYLDLLNNTDIFRIEVMILLDYIERKGIINKTTESLKEFLCSKVISVLENNNDFNNNINNAINKINLTILNLLQVGIIKEFKNNDLIFIESYNPEWILFLFLITEEFKIKKLTFSQIKNSQSRKNLFISINKLRDLIDKIKIEGYCLVENQAGLDQIDLKYDNIEELVMSL